MRAIAYHGGRTGEIRLFEETPLSVLRITIHCSEFRFLETSVFSKRPLERRLCFHKRSSWVTLGLLQYDYCNSQSLFVWSSSLGSTAFFWTKNSRAQSLNQGEGVAISKLDRDSNLICVVSNLISLLQEPGGGECVWFSLADTNSSSSSSGSNGSGNNSRGALVSFQVSLVGCTRWCWCYRFFRNRFFLSRLSREVEDAEVEVSSRLCDWWGGDGAEFKPGDEVPEWWCRLKTTLMKKDIWWHKLTEFSGACILYAFYIF